MKRKSVAWFLLVVAFNLYGEEKQKPLTDRQTQEKELKRISKELVPIRQATEKTKPVLEARARLDAAFSEYYDVLREEMKKQSPEANALVEQELKLRKKLYGEHGGGRVKTVE